MPLKKALAARPYLRRIGTRRLKSRFEAIRKLIKEHPHARYPARPRNINRFGKLFLASFPVQEVHKGVLLQTMSSMFESPVAVGLLIPGKLQLVARLGFTSNGVVVEAIQGQAGSKRDVDNLSDRLGKPWANFLLEQIENHARGVGFSHAYMRTPETMWYYQRPMAGTLTETVRHRIDRVVKDRLALLKRRVERNGQVQLSEEERTHLDSDPSIDSLGSVLQQEGLLKNRKLVGDISQGLWDALGFSLRQLHERLEMRRGIKNFYSRMAQGNGYKKKGAFFIKRL